MAQRKGNRRTAKRDDIDNILDDLLASDEEPKQTKKFEKGKAKTKPQSLAKGSTRKGKLTSDVSEAEFYKSLKTYENENGESASEGEDLSDEAVRKLTEDIGDLDDLDNDLFAGLGSSKKPQKKISAGTKSNIGGAKKSSQNKISSYDPDDPLADLGLSDDADNITPRPQQKRTLSKRLSNEKLKIQPAVVKDFPGKQQHQKDITDQFMSTDAKEGKQAPVRASSFDESENEFSPKHNEITNLSKQSAGRRQRADDGTGSTTQKGRNSLKKLAAKNDDLFEDDEDLPGLSDTEASLKVQVTKVKSKATKPRKMDDDIFGNDEGLPGFSDDDAPKKEVKKSAVKDDIIPNEKASSALTNLLGNSNRNKKKSETPTMLDQILAGKTNTKDSTESPKGSPSRKASLTFGSYSPSTSLNKGTRPNTTATSRQVHYSDEMDLNESLTRPSTVPAKKNTESPKSTPSRRQQTKKDSKSNADWLGLGDDLTDQLGASQDDNNLFSPRQRQQKKPSNGQRIGSKDLDSSLTLPWESPSKKPATKKDGNNKIEKEAEDDFLNLLKKKKPQKAKTDIIADTNIQSENHPPKKIVDNNLSQDFTNEFDKQSLQQQQQQPTRIEETLSRNETRQGNITNDSARRQEPQLITNENIQHNTVIQNEKTQILRQQNQINMAPFQQNSLYNQVNQSSSHQNFSTNQQNVIPQNQYTAAQNQQNLYPNNQNPLYLQQSQLPNQQILSTNPIIPNQQNVTLNQNSTTQNQQNIISDQLTNQHNQLIPNQYGSLVQQNQTMQNHQFQQQQAVIQEPKTFTPSSEDLKTLEDKLKVSLEKKYQEEFNVAKRQFERDNAYMESSVKELQEKMLKLEESNSAHTSDYAAKIREIEESKRKLELEKQELIHSKETFIKRHKDEMEATTNSHKSRVKFVEESYLRREKQLIDEHELSKSYLEDQLRQKDDEKSDVMKTFNRKIEVLELNQQKEIERLKDLHKKSIGQLVEEHETQLNHMRLMKEQEINAAVDAFSHTKSLKTLIQEVHNSTREVSTLQNKIDSHHKTKLEEREMALKSREQYISNLEERLQQQEISNEEERQRLQMLVSKMEVQLREQTRQIEQDRWKLNQDENRLRTMKAAFDEERKQMNEKLFAERDQITQSRDELLAEQRSIMSECYEEKRRIADEKTQLMELQKQLLEKNKLDRTSVEKAEGDLESILKRYEKESSTVGVRLTSLKVAEEKLLEEKSALMKQQKLFDEEMQRLNEAAAKIQKKSEKVEEYAVEAKKIHEEGVEALRVGNLTKADYEDRLRRLESGELNLKMAEKRLQESEESLVKERKIFLEEKSKNSQSCPNCGDKINTGSHGNPYNGNPQIYWNLPPTAESFRHYEGPYVVSTPIPNPSFVPPRPVTPAYGIEPPTSPFPGFNSKRYYPSINMKQSFSPQTDTNFLSTNELIDRTQDAFSNSVAEHLPPPDVILNNIEFKREMRRYENTKVKDDSFFEEETRFLKTLQEKRTK